MTALWGRLNGDPQFVPARMQLATATVQTLSPRPLILRGLRGTRLTLTAT